jgi:hypothetical protein
MLALIRHAVEEQYSERCGIEVGPVMHCIDCKAVLLLAARGWWCPQCSAELWLFSRLSSHHHERLTAYLTSHALPMEYPMKGRLCPGCRESFAVVNAPRNPENEGRSEWARTRVDVCLLCQWVWLDPGELEEARTRYDNTSD